MKRSFAAAVLAAIALAASACGSSQRTTSPPTTSRPTNSPTTVSSRLILGGRVRCTATVKSPVQAGHELGLSVTFHNLSKHPISIQPGYGGVRVVVSSPDGTTYDTSVPIENETGLRGVGAISVQPGATTTQRVSNLRVRWQGPLSVTPSCGLSAAPPLRVAVSSPGLPASESAAVADVVAATGHLLDHCRPRASGVSVVGRVSAPDRGAPPLQTRCSVTLHREGDFYEAQVLVVSPPDLRGAGVHGPYEDLTPHWQAGQIRNAQVIGWEFVVTRDGAFSVYSAETAETRSGGRAPDYTWSGAAGQRSGGGQCGFTGGGFGGKDGPSLTFVSACGR